MVVLVVSSADKQGLPRFRPPEGNTLLPACLIIDVCDCYNGVPARWLSRRDLVAIRVKDLYWLVLDRRPSQPLYRSLGLGSS